MATAAKLAIVTPQKWCQKYGGLYDGDRCGMCDCDLRALGVAEEYAQLSGEEIFAASRETSKVYNGQVLAKAVLIVQTRMRCSNLTKLANYLGVGRVTAYRWVSGRPVTDYKFSSAMRNLAALLEEAGDLPSARWKRDR